jgi:K+-transporting ATPase KdpF subunit
VSAENAIGLILAILVLGYLIYALVYPERLG